MRFDARLSSLFYIQKMKEKHCEEHRTYGECKFCKMEKEKKMRIKINEIENPIIIPLVLSLLGIIGIFFAKTDLGMSFIIISSLIFLLVTAHNIDCAIRSQNGKRNKR